MYGLRVTRTYPNKIFTSPRLQEYLQANRIADQGKVWKKNAAKPYENSTNMTSRLLRQQKSSFKPSAARLTTSAAEALKIPGRKVCDEYTYTLLLLLLLPLFILRDIRIVERRERSHSIGNRICTKVTLSIFHANLPYSYRNPKTTVKTGFWAFS